MQIRALSFNLHSQDAVCLCDAMRVAGICGFAWISCIRFTLSGSLGGGEGASGSNGLRPGLLQLWTSAHRECQVDLQPEASMTMTLEMPELCAMVEIRILRIAPVLRLTKPGPDLGQNRPHLSPSPGPRVKLRSGFSGCP